MSDPTFPTMSEPLAVKVFEPTLDVSTDAGPEHVARPDPPSLHRYDELTICPSTKDEPSAGVVMVTVGPFLSILLPPIGPAVVQLLTASQNECEFVAALPSSAPAGTLVDREAKSRSGPEPPSLEL